MLALAGCETLFYYSHLATGQIRLLTARQPTAALMRELEDRREPGARPSLLYRRLDFSERVLAFAERELALPVEGRYGSFVELDRPAVVWNVFAAPPLSLEPYRWCHPFVGCTPYRGYFDPERAERKARALAAEGYETFVGQVAAYSTLGWFDDPLLSTFVMWPEADLAELLLHELAHGVIWVNGDAPFNEAFATFVGRQGLSEWLDAADDPEARRRQHETWEKRARVLELLERTRDALARVYGSNLAAEEKHRVKARVLDAARGCYARRRRDLGDGRFDFLMADLSNARLGSIATYEDLVPAFEAVFEEANGQWPAFFDAVRTLAELPDAARASRLERLAEEQVAQAGDDGGAEEVECEALFRHVLDAEAGGGVHDHVGRRGHGQHEGA